MLFYYAYSGHKNGLERVRRAAAVIKKLKAKGMKTTLLVNDFRAGLVAKEMGVQEYVTIETVQDIDAIAEVGDSIIIDSLEDDHGRLVKYCSDFKHVWRFAHSLEDKSIHGEILIRAACEEVSCIDALSVDDIYFENTKKEKRILFFLGDADYNKIVLNHADFFKEFEMELLLGNYFFVKYEDELAKLFSTLHEPEEYECMIKSSEVVVTASSQTAIEAKINGAKVIYIEYFEDSIYPSQLLKLFDIDIVRNFDEQAVKTLLLQDNLSKMMDLREQLNVISDTLVNQILEYD